MYRWCVAAFSSDLWNIPTPVDQILDGHIVWMHVKIMNCASSSGHLNNIQGRNLGTCCTCCVTQGPLGSVCLQLDSDHMCLWPGYHLHHDTTKHGYSGVVTESTGEWNKSVELQLRRANRLKRLLPDTIQGALWLAKRLSLNLNVSFLNRILLLLVSSSYPIVLTRLGEPRSRPYTSRIISRV